VCSQLAISIERSYQWDVIVMYQRAAQPAISLPVGCDCHVSVCCPISGDEIVMYQCVAQLAISLEWSCRWDVTVILPSVCSKWRSALPVGCDCHVSVYCPISGDEIVMYKCVALLAISLEQSSWWDVIVMDKCAAQPAISLEQSFQW